jgi:Ca2+-binding EF-hand superfamily protein
LPEFVPYAAFKRLDRGDKGFVTQQDLMRFLHSNGFWNRQNFDESHCAALIQNFDSDEMPGTLKY